MTDDALLTVTNLHTRFRSGGDIARAVDGVSFTLHRGETLAIVGESGSGKSVTALSIMRLVPIPPGEITQGSVMFRGRDLLRLPERAMRRVRGNEISMIFQEPMSSLNPLLKVGEQIAEVARAHRGLRTGEARQHAIDMLARVRIPDPALRALEYPHRLSGGMRQRVMIAMALACHPSLLIADEPTTALDVTIQSQILDLMRGLQAELTMSVLFITHNLGVVAEIADRVAVMYAGRIVEQGTVEAVFARPLHPYTVALLASIPRVEGSGRDPARRLAAIPGQVPSAIALPQGCAYAPRCARATALCRQTAPPIIPALPGHEVRCHHWSGA
ncbi:MAG TPA: ABC transporter ATP-binding protein [Acetobacteraceae bacterium]|jgi:oligopeptide/dipeptide ABC transporter ATP-binding protein|nr:ABC transporter ATP-binding protein [Acetobacteraceae bacterium]